MLAVVPSMVMQFELLLEDQRIRSRIHEEIVAETMFSGFVLGLLVDLAGRYEVHQTGSTDRMRGRRDLKLNDPRLSSMSCCDIYLYK